MQVPIAALFTALASPAAPGRIAGAAATMLELRSQVPTLQAFIFFRM